LSAKERMIWLLPPYGPLWYVSQYPLKQSRELTVN
jgi:hypothetical protein